ncbi:hypothetical protein A2767_03575 [Candidatus Roizmanbacteria bacterium RIFCSPHIGHO2_01_FULL_35_10]|uniref:Glutamyl-tRNA amidotransferase n=1 Tax=Candidatus Roizmanbacteria bacterium RIFCSPLOWO2_01_FULL_35_13 TaxID=1802055 RepID=A0A1F7IA28_9BACT|nr:MAG: hypothetical protein A2767_03575 [Candidatus Roizmanbacteria bacterium RIFCSPHIGHO2_01_FULL_35_10]OGK40207.1 MAG: hypothetical protein A3A74_06895 [Candidatus Roizmanbacteria bacterium RIFCSPLOWO2_01_FULL_35_13]
MLRKKIVADQIQSLKNHDQEKLSILRYILAQIKNKEIDKKIELIDEEIITVLRKIAKELNESIEAFKKGKREDLISDYQKQLDIVSVYLPKEISDEDLKKEIEKIVAENKEIYDKNPEAIIGVCVGKLKNKAESSRIVRLLQSSIKV